MGQDWDKVGALIGAATGATNAIQRATLCSPFYLYLKY